MSAKKAICRDKKIMVGMSGGVDSSLAAAILKDEGCDVIGVTFKIWPKLEGTIKKARAVAKDLGISYRVADFNEPFNNDVIDYFCRSYLKGFTPNPCVVCNEKIKFGKLLALARSLGASKVATGHYARVSFDKKKKRFLLKEGKDKTKDQSYFLSRLSQGQLKSAIFPLGGITKERVKALAKKIGIRTHDAVSSQDICFIKGSNYAEFIKKRTGIAIKGGEIVDCRGKILGWHKGAPFYTIGQRRGLGIAYKEPLYVTGIDVKTNRLIVGTKKEVLKKGLIADCLNWISIDEISKPLKVMARIRYNHKKAKATVTKIGADSVRVEFDEPQAAPTPGQAVVFYDKDVVVGGGWIREAV